MSVRKLRDAMVVMGAFLALLWIVQVANWADGYRLDGEFGILPQHLSSLPDIFAAPFLHFSWQHIEGNSVPLFVLGVLAAYRSLIRFLLLSLVVVVVSGLGVWIFQASNELTVGASGLIFGYFGYVVIRGFVDRNLADIGAGIVAGLLYWTILQVAIPGTPGVSWIGHLSGLAGGVLAAWLLRNRTPAVAGASAGGPATAIGSPAGPGKAEQDGRPGVTPTPRPRQRPRHPGSQAAEDLLRELKDMGL